MEGSYKKSRNCRTEYGHSFTVHCSDCSTYQSSLVGEHLVHGGEKTRQEEIFVIHRRLEDVLVCVLLCIAAGGWKFFFLYQFVL